jgi:hypothetical protein
MEVSDQFHASVALLLEKQTAISTGQAECASEQVWTGWQTQNNFCHFQQSNPCHPYGTETLYYN